MPPSDQHVVPLPGDVWGVTTEDSDDYTNANVYPSKADAIDAAISIAQREGVDLIVHGKSGQPFLSPPGSSLDEYSLRHATRGLGTESRPGRKAAKGGGSPRKSPGASAKKGGGKGSAKKSGGSKASARKSAAGKGGAKKSAAKAAKSAAARKSSGKAGGRR